MLKHVLRSDARRGAARRGTYSLLFSDDYAGEEFENGGVHIVTLRNKHDQQKLVQWTMVTGINCEGTW